MTIESFFGAGGSFADREMKHDILRQRMHKVFPSLARASGHSASGVEKWQ